MDTPAEGQRAMVDLGVFFYQLTLDKRAHPADDM
jgi:hypothetical protein